jgi:hypothetical protein
MAVYAFGHPGQWWAEVMGVRYGTVGTMRFHGDHYKQTYSLNGGKSTGLLEALEKHQKVVVREEICQPNGIYKVIGYDALYHIKNLEVTKDTIRGTRTIEFDIVQPRIVGLKNR